MNLMDLLSPSTKISLLLEKLKKSAAGFESAIIRSTDQHANQYTMQSDMKFSQKFRFLNILVEEDGRSIRFMGKKLPKSVQLISATL